MTPTRYYHQGWIAAAGVVFLLLLLMAMCRGQEFQPPVTNASFSIFPPGMVSDMQPNWQGPVHPYLSVIVTPTNELKTVSMTATNDGEYLIWTVESQGDLQASTNLTEWVSVNNEPEVYSRNIVGYTSLTNAEYRKVFFRGVPMP